MIDDNTNLGDVGASSEGMSVGGQEPVVNTPGERTFTQDEVNKIVHERTRAVKDRERKEFESKLEGMKSQQMLMDDSPVNTAASGLTESQIKELVDKDIERRLREQREVEEQQFAKTVADTFVNHIRDGQSKYDDFDEQFSNVDFSSRALSPLVPLINSMDNASDIYYDLSKNSHKLSDLISRVSVMHPEKAAQYVQSQLSQLSSTIKKNEQALNQPQPKAPLSKVTSSNLGLDNDSRPSVAKERLNPLLRV